MSQPDYEISDDGLIYYPDGDADYDVEPRYYVTKDRSGTTHVEVQEGFSEYVIWDIVKDRMIKLYDAHETIF